MILNKHLKESLISFELDFIVKAPPVNEPEKFISFYQLLYDKLHLIMFDVHFRRWHWYSFYNHKKFFKVRCPDGVIRLLPFLPKCK